jgi:hypothetical protein
LPLGRAVFDGCSKGAPDQQQAFSAQPNQYCSVATTAILFQAMAVYFFSAFLKSGPEWYEDGTAIYYALNLDEVATGLAHYWRNEHWLTVPLTRFVWWLELLGPDPHFYTAPAGAGPIADDARVHRNGGGLYFEPFILACFVYLDHLDSAVYPQLKLGCAGSAVLAQCRRRAHDVLRSGLRLLLKMCWLLKIFLGLRSAQIIPAQTDAEMAEILEREFSWVVVTPAGERLIKWPAMVAVFAASPWGWLLAPMLAWPQRLGNRIYDSVANNRGAFGEWFAALLPWQATVKMPGWPSHAVAGFFLAYLLLFNLSTIPNWRLPFQAAAEGQTLSSEIPKSLAGR